MKVEKLYAELGVYDDGVRVYSSKNKPAVGDLNAVAKTGDTMTGPLVITQDNANPKLIIHRTNNNTNVSLGFQDMNNRLVKLGLGGDNHLYYGTSDDISGAGSKIYSTGFKPTWADIGGNSMWTSSSDHIVAASGKNWIRSANPSGGFLPTSSGTGSSAVGMIGTSAWWFREAWVNTFRGGSMNVSSKVTCGGLATSSVIQDTRLPSANQQLVNCNGPAGLVYVGNPTNVSRVTLETTSAGGAYHNTHQIYTTNYKPTLDVLTGTAVKALDSSTLTGKTVAQIVSEARTGLITAANVYTKTEADARFFNKAGGTVTGKIHLTAYDPLELRQPSGWSYLTIKSGAQEAHIAQTDAAAEGAAANSLHLRPLGGPQGSLIIQPNAQMMHKTSHGYVKIGSANTTYCHYDTDRPNHWFNKPLKVAGEIYAGTSYNQRVYHTGYKPSAADVNAYTKNQDIVIDKAAPRLWLRGDINSSDAGKLYITEDTNHGGWIGYNGSANSVQYGYRANSVDGIVFSHDYNSNAVTFTGSIATPMITVNTAGGVGTRFGSSAWKALVGVSSTANEYLFGGTSNGSTSFEHYIRIGANKFQFNNQDVYHTGRKPSWADIGGNSYWVNNSIGGTPCTQSVRGWIAAKTNHGYLPSKASTGASATEHLGTSSWWFKETWSNWFRGGSVNVTGEVKGSSAHIVGGDVVMAIPNTTGGWARGVTFKAPSGTGNTLVAAGAHGGGATASSYHIGFGPTWYDNPSLTVTSTQVVSKQPFTCAQYMVAASNISIQNGVRKHLIFAGTDGRATGYVYNDPNGDVTLSRGVMSNNGLSVKSYGVHAAANGEEKGAFYASNVAGGSWDSWQSRSSGHMMEIPAGGMNGSAYSLLKATSWGEAHYFVMDMHGHLANFTLRMRCYGRDHKFAGRSITSGGFVQSHDSSVDRTEPTFRNKTATSALDAITGITSERVVYHEDRVKAGTGYVSINPESVKNSFPEAYEETLDTTVKNGEVTTGVDLGAMVALQLEAIKELKEQNQVLLERIETLERRG